MATNKKGLLLAGLAAFAYYKYSKLSPEQKKNLFSDIKEKGKKLMDEYLPSNVRNQFSSSEPAANSSSMEPEYGKGTF